MRYVASVAMPSPPTRADASLAVLPRAHTPVVESPMSFGSLRSLLIALPLFVPAAATAQVANGNRFEITISPSARTTPVTGRLVLAVSKNFQNEPRYLIAPNGAAIFGVDLDQLQPGRP